MNRNDYQRIRRSVYGSVFITPDARRGEWLVTGINLPAITEAARGSFPAILSTLRTMQDANELADILPVLIDWARDGAAGLAA